jgi:phosphatidylglycerol lysyltransferase
MKTKFLHILGPLFGLLLFGVALWVLHHELKVYHLEDILQHIEKLPLRRILLALLLTALSYLIMTGYDFLALQYIRRPLAYTRIALASFVGYAFSNNIGLSMLAGGSVRYRLYSSWGLSIVEITKVIGFCTMTLWLGFFLLGGVVFVFDPVMIPEALHVPFVSIQPIGGIFLIIVAAYLAFSLFRRRPFTLGGWEFTLPSSRLFVGQMAVAFLDWAIAGSVLYVLLPDSSRLPFFGFLGIFLLAQFAGLLSQVPGGLGVFETVAVILLSPALPGSEVFGSLLAYRGIYYLLPLGVATVLLGAQEVIQKKALVQKLTRTLGHWSSLLVPHVFAFTTFLGGAILLFSGATPAIASRLGWLKDFLPLPVMEISHFLGSVIGAALLLLARGLQRRINAAYNLTAVLLTAGILSSLLKGVDYEEAIILSVMLLALLSCRSQFYRKAFLLGHIFSPGWIASIALVLICSVWLGAFSYKHVEYSSDLWWRFTLHGDAPRFLRATLGAVTLTLFFALAKLLRPSPPKPVLSPQKDLARALPTVLSSPKTYANLALLGDKSLLFSPNGTAFIMYGVEGKSWISMGDPVGQEEEWRELLWSFRELCDRYGGWTVFYEIGSENLHLYLDLDLTFLKLGEEARVPLEKFSLEGGARKGLRHTYRKLEKEGCVFEIIPSERVPTFLPEFKAISDAWLTQKNTREKGFSLGFFDESYLKRFPAGVIRKEGRLLAFTNVWQGARKEELSIDLMRYAPDSPSGVMEYLFIHLMLWGKQDGYRWFNLGMAPLSGLQDHELGPLWNRLGAFLFRHGEHFYNLQGLRQYKDKFDPEWQAKYLASPGGFAVPRILANIASLISGGMEGVITK